MGTTIYNSNDPRLQRRVPTTLTASKTFTGEDDGGVFLIATDALTMTLPLIDANNIGMELTFVNTGADGNNIITLAPNALDAFHGGVVTSTGANADATTSEALLSWASGAIDKDFVNTKATANKGDSVTVVALATTHWQITAGAGEWASEA